MRTEVLPALVELKEIVGQPDKPWYSRVSDVVTGASTIAAAFSTMTPAVASIAAASSIGGLVASEIQAHKGKKDAIKRTGIYYLLKVDSLTAPPKTK